MEDFKVPPGKKMVGSLDISLPEGAGIAMLKFIQIPDDCDTEEMFGAIYSLMSIAVDLEENQTDTFLPILLPALAYALERLRFLEGDLYDTDWRNDIRGMLAKKN